MNQGIEQACRAFRLERFNAATGEHATVRDAFRAGGEHVAKRVMADVMALFEKGEVVDLELLQQMFKEALLP